MATFWAKIKYFDALYIIIYNKAIVMLMRKKDISNVIK